MDTSDPTIRLERRRCGKPTCKCARPDHPGHGPYLYRTKTVAGKTKREYLGGPFTQRKG